MQKVNAITFSTTGGPEVLQLCEVDLPDPGPGEVQVRHTAIGLNFVDTYQRSGLYPVSLPSGLGAEAAGVIVKLGKGVKGFKLGDRVRTLNVHPSGHTRLPRYARGKTGTVERIHGCHAYPDAVASGKGDDPQWLYTVVFDGKEIWGPDTDPTLTVSIDAFEPYLEPA